MLASLGRKIGDLFEHAERSRRDAYLASSRDIGELERRMRSIERNGYSECNVPELCNAYPPDLSQSRRE